MTRKERDQEQMLIAGCIYGFVGFVMLCAFGAGVWGVITTLNPALVPISAIFGIFGFAATFATIDAAIHAAHAASGPSLIISAAIYAAYAATSAARAATIPLTTLAKQAMEEA